MARPGLDPGKPGRPPCQSGAAETTEGMASIARERREMAVDMAGMQERTGESEGKKAEGREAHRVMARMRKEKKRSRAGESANSTTSCLQTRAASVHRRQ